MASWLTRIVGKVEPQATGYLLRAPCPGPSPILAPPVPPALPGHGRPRDRGSARGDDHAGQPVLHIAPQRRGDRQLRRLRTPRRPLGVPLRGGGPIVQTAATRSSIAPQLPRDRRGRSPQPAGDLAHPVALRAPQRDLLSIREGQVPPRGRLRRWRKRRWGHAARLPEPSCPYCRRHSCAERRVLTGLPRRNRRPEPPL